MPGVTTELANSSLLNQIPLAGLVVLVVALFLYFLDRWLKAERDARAIESDAMRNFIKSEREQSAIFLREQREQYNSTIGRLAEKVEHIAVEVSTLNGLLSAHDARSQERGKATGSLRS